jgi:hypothetical protein
MCLQLNLSQVPPYLHPCFYGAGARARAGAGAITAPISDKYLWPDSKYRRLNGTVRLLDVGAHWATAVIESGLPSKSVPEQPPAVGVRCASSFDLMVQVLAFASAGV